MKKPKKHTGPLTGLNDADFKRHPRVRAELSMRAAVLRPADLADDGASWSEIHSALLAATALVEIAVAGDLTRTP